MENVEEKGYSGMVNGGKTYYSISEVCGQIGVEPHVLRYGKASFRCYTLKRTVPATGPTAIKTSTSSNGSGICYTKKDSPSRVRKRNLRNCAPPDSRLLRRKHRPCRPSGMSGKNSRGSCIC